MPTKVPLPPPRPFTAPTGPHCGSCLLGGRSAACKTPPGSGYFAGEGLGTTGLMIVSDHLGGDDSGDRALIGPSGFILGQVMRRKQVARIDVWYETVLRCEPTQPIRAKNGKPAPWLAEAVNHCSAHLNAAITAKQPKAFLALGELAFTALTGVELRAGLNMNAVRGYVFPERHGRGWVVASHHPDIMRLGQWMYATTLEWDLDRALRIAREGFRYEDDLNCLMDPATAVWEPQVEAVIAAIHAGRVPFLAADIETPFKKGKRQSEKGDETATDDPTYTIDRISACWSPTDAFSVPWRMPYLPGIERLLAAAVAAGVPVIFWNRAYDRPRLIHNGIPLPIERTQDTMDLYHVCFNHLPKKLGFATSCLPSSSRFRIWKHLAASQPALYSCMDVISLFRNHADCTQIAHETGQWPVYEEICLRLDPALSHMTAVGMPIDAAFRQTLSAQLGVRMREIEGQINAVVPDEIKPVQVWKTRKGAEKGVAKLQAAGEVGGEAVLKELDGERETSYCSVCGEVDVKKGHFKPGKVKPAVDAVQGGLFDDQG